MSKRQNKKKVIDKLKKQERLKLSLKYKRLKIISSYKNFHIKQTTYNKDMLKKNNFINNLLEILTLFTNKKYHIKLIFQHVNKGMTIKLNKIEKKELKKKNIITKTIFQKTLFC